MDGLKGQKISAALFLAFNFLQNECKHFEITRTICSNCERSEQFLVTECFFNLFLKVSHIYNKLEQLEFKLEKIIGI